MTSNHHAKVMRFRWQIVQPLAGMLAHTGGIAVETGQDAVMVVGTTVENESLECLSIRIPTMRLRTLKHTWVIGIIGGFVGGKVVQNGGWNGNHA